MRVFMFLPRFVEPIISGTKTHTIRWPRKRMPMPGDNITMRRWESVPYRSRHIEFYRAVITSVSPIVISIEDCGKYIDFPIVVNGARLRGEAYDRFLRADGFRDVYDFASHWRPTLHQRPFIGHVYSWKLG